MKPDDPDFEPTLKSLMSELTQHMKEEERDDLPALEKTMQKADSEELANSFNRTKAFVPTRYDEAAQQSL